MNQDYLNRVLTYLQQELPQHKDSIQAVNGRIIVTLTDNCNFQQAYELLHPNFLTCIGRIRNRAIDLEFTIRSASQERDFKILK